MMQSRHRTDLGVLAHETGHWPAPPAKMREQLARRRPKMIIAMLLGAARWSRAREAAAIAVWPMRRAAVVGPQEMIRRTLIAMCASRRKRRPAPGEILTATGQSARACTRPSSGSPMRACSPHAAPTLFAVASDARRPASPRCRNSRVRALLGQERRPGFTTPPRYGARRRFRLHGAAGTVYRRYPCRTPACLRVTRTPSRLICTAICAARWRRSRPWTKLQPLLSSLRAVPAERCRSERPAPRFRKSGLHLGNRAADLRQRAAQIAVQISR